MATVESIAQLDEALDGATLWGLELDPRYRVLAATLELVPGSHPWQLPDDDPRIQLLCSPVSTILASFRRVEDGQAQLFVFPVEQLVDVAATFGGAPLLGTRFGHPEPRPGSWAPQWSLEGRSSAPDGTARTVTIAVRQPDGEGRMELDLFARFDDVQVNDAMGESLATLSAGGPGIGGPGLDLGL